MNNSRIPVQSAPDSQKSPVAQLRCHRLQDTGEVFGLGYSRDLPDFRDFSPRMTETVLKKHLSTSDDTRKVIDALSKVVTSKKPLKKSHLDNEQYCSPIENQLSLGSCTAQACIGLVEYMQRRATGEHLDASSLFLYKVSRALLGWTGDTGAYLRTTMKALVLFGVPPEEWWPYDIDTYEHEPDAFLYQYASNYKAMKYIHLDPPGTQPGQLLEDLKRTLSAGYLSMFGFTVYSSLGRGPEIPYPVWSDKVTGGHAVIAVGYDDNYKNASTSDKGAIRIRNSWGTGWGDNGYGWLPYDYIKQRLANDFWTLTKASWVDTNQFKL